ncbi:hypothetical protein EMIT019CA3_430003 [Bacillus pseudomycoides]
MFIYIPLQKLACAYFYKEKAFYFIEHFYCDTQYNGNTMRNMIILIKFSFNFL